MSGKTTIYGGAFQDASGNTLANGYLTMQLSHDEQESVDPGQVVSGLSLRVPLDANGNIVGTVYVWPNDQLDPSNSYYIVNAYRRDGTLAWGAPQFVSVPSSPSPYNVGNWIPVNPVASGTGAPVGSLLLQVNGINNADQAKLNLESTDSSVTITDEGSGNINLQAVSSGFSTSGYGGFWSAGFDMMGMFGLGLDGGGGMVCTATNQVVVFQFTTAVSWKISSVSAYVVTGSNGSTFNFGIYSSSGNKLIDSGTFSGTTGSTALTNTITPVTLPVATYYFACSASSSSVTVQGFEINSIPFVNTINANGSVKVGVAANATSGGSMPSTLGTISASTYTSNSISMPGAFFGV
jgi:hypothetical protein